MRDCLGWLKGIRVWSEGQSRVAACAEEGANCMGIVGYEMARVVLVARGEGRWSDEAGGDHGGSVSCLQEPQHQTSPEFSRTSTVCRV